MNTTEITDLKKTLKKCVVYLDTIEMLSEKLRNTEDVREIVRYKDMATLCRNEVVSLLSTVYGNI